MKEASRLSNKSNLERRDAGRTRGECHAAALRGLEPRLLVVQAGIMGSIVVEDRRWALGESESQLPPRNSGFVLLTDEALIRCCNIWRRDLQCDTADKSCVAYPDESR